MSILPFAVGWLVTGVSAAMAQEPTAEAPATVAPTSTNYDAWRERILPCDEELTWQTIPWLTSFSAGIVAAHDADKPLLLWTMNGHPLGCT